MFEERFDAHAAALDLQQKLAIDGGNMEVPADRFRPNQNHEVVTSQNYEGYGIDLQERASETVPAANSGLVEHACP